MSGPGKRPPTSPNINYRHAAKPRLGNSDSHLGALPSQSVSAASSAALDNPSAQRQDDDLGHPVAAASAQGRGLPVEPVPTGSTPSNANPALARLLSTAGQLTRTRTSFPRGITMHAMGRLTYWAMNDMKLTRAVLARCVDVIRALLQGMPQPDFPVTSKANDDDLGIILQKNENFFSDVRRMIELAAIMPPTQALSDQLLVVLQYLAYDSKSDVEQRQPVSEKVPAEVVSAWRAPLVGSSHFDLLSDIREKHNSNVKNDSQNYHNNITVLQSSGTGKSRSVQETSPYILLIPLVLRPDNDKSGYPRADIRVREFLVPTEEIPNEEEYRDRVRYFLRIVFQSIGAWLRRNPVNAADRDGTVSALWDYLFKVNAWRLFLQRERDILYSAIVTAAEAARKSHKDKDSEIVKASLQAFIRILKGVEPEAWDDSHVPDVFKEPMSSSDYIQVVNATNEAISSARRNGDKYVLPSNLGLDSTGLLVLLAFDEAHGLTQTSLPEPPTASKAKPDPDNLKPKRPKTAYGILLSVLNDLRSLTVGLFLSTYTKLGQFAPPAALAPSARQTESSLLQPPFTEMPFDCFLDPPLQVGSDELKLANLSSISFMAKFGRPLFGSFLIGTANASPEERFERESRLLALTRAKLAGHANPSTVPQDFKDNDAANAYVAVLDVRLRVPFEPRKSATVDSKEAELVASHMRLAYTVPSHRMWILSGYSSEPVIAEAAATLMMDWRKESNWTPLKTLVKLMENGLIDLGERGELVARLLLTLAYDSAMGKQESASRFSTGCKLVEFLGALFGETNMCVLDGIKPDNIPTRENGPEPQTLSQAFETSVVRFTHFVKLGDSSGLTTTALCAAFVRGMAFIGRTNQPLVDIIIPVLWKKDAPICPGNMTAILIQVKRRVERGAAGVYDYTAEKLQLFDDSDKEAASDDPLDQRIARPYCTLLMELIAPMPKAAHPTTPPRSAANKPPAPPTPSVLRASTVPERSSARLQSANLPHPRYNIRVYGCSHTVYGVIGPHNSDHGKTMYSKLLATQHFAHDHPRRQLLKWVWQMKPLWVTNERFKSFAWFKATVPEEPDMAAEDAQEGIRAVQYGE